MKQRTNTVLVIAALLGVACRDEGPPVVTTVVVTSPIGTRLGVGRTVQLTAEPRDAGNGTLTVPVTWRSSAPAVANVGTDGSVSGDDPGTAMISAEAGGVTGSVTLQVIAADFAGMTATLSDAFVAALWPQLTAAVRGRVLAAMTQCATGITQGNFNSIDACLAAARAEVTAAVDATDRPLLATAALFFDHAERLLIP